MLSSSTVDQLNPVHPHRAKFPRRGTRIRQLSREFCSLSRMTPSRGLLMPHDSRRTRRTQRTSLSSLSPISSREDRRRSAEFDPDRDYGSEVYRFESCRARHSPKGSEARAGRENGWSPPGRQPTQNRAQSSGEGGLAAVFGASDVALPVAARSTARARSRPIVISHRRASRCSRRLGRRLLGLRCTEHCTGGTALDAALLTPTTLRLLWKTFRPATPLSSLAATSAHLDNRLSRWIKAWRPPSTLCCPPVPGRLVARGDAEGKRRGGS